MHLLKPNRGFPNVPHNSALTSSRTSHSSYLTFYSWLMNIQAWSLKNQSTATLPIFGPATSNEHNDRCKYTRHVRVCHTVR